MLIVKLNGTRKNEPQEYVRSKVSRPDLGKLDCQPGASLSPAVAATGDGVVILPPVLVLGLVVGQELTLVHRLLVALLHCLVSTASGLTSKVGRLLLNGNSRQAKGGRLTA